MATDHTHGSTSRPKRLQRLHEPIIAILITIAGSDDILDWTANISAG